MNAPRTTDSDRKADTSTTATTEPTAATVLVSCPQCGKKYRVKAASLQKALQCKCGGKLQPLIQTDGKPAPQVVVNSVYANALASRRKVALAVERGEDDTKANPITEVYIPLAVVAVCMAIMMFLAPRMLPEHVLPWLYLPAALALAIVVFMPASFGVLLMVASFSGTSLGTLRNVLFKLAAVTLGTGMIADLIFFCAALRVQDYAPAPLYGVMPYLPLVGAPLGIMLGLSIAETVGMSLLLIIPRFIVFLVLLFAVPKLFA